MTDVTWAEVVDYIPAPPTPESQVSTIDSLDAQNQAFSRRDHPLEHASPPSIVLAHWMQPMISLGAQRVLEVTDMWPIGANDSCDSVETRFRRVYDPRPQFLSISPVAMAIAKTFRKEIVFVLFGSVLYIVALAVQSYVAQALLEFLNDRENIFGITNGYWLVAMMTISSLVAVCTVNYVFFTTSRIGANVRSLAMTLVFDKALKLSSAARQEHTAGEVFTLMSVDAERIFTATLQSPWHVLGPLAFVVSIVMIGILLDAFAAMAGAVVLVVVMSISVQQGDRIAHLQRKLLEVIEERVKVTSEALQGIRVMKFYAWEESVALRVEHIRSRELGLLRKFHSFQALNTVMLFLTPTFLSGVTLGLYVLVHDTIDVVKAFTLIAMVNICRTALFQLPQAISSLCKARIALSRIDEFLASDEVAVASLRLPSAPPNDDRSTLGSPLLSTRSVTENGAVSCGSISFRGASFRWPAGPRKVNVIIAASVADASADDKPQNEEFLGDGGFQLEGINLEIERGSLVMIVGKVGAGKSSLINAILGEMPRTSGVLEIGGRVAYVSQDTWIRNATLRDNILFEQDYDADRYQRVLEASQLGMDLHALPNGDATEIGERGINLSGGQKARVAIARAMYRADTDVLILDDPLSAVDPHVAHAIFEECIVGLAADQTRLLVVNSHYDLLPQADHVVVLQDGVISAHGSYEAVFKECPRFSSTFSEADSAVVETPIPPAKQRLEDRDDDGEAAFNELASLSGGRLIQDEDRVRGSVGGEVYKTYFDETGFNGVLVVLVLCLAYAASQAVRTIVDWWPGHWARSMTRFGVDPSYSGTVFGMWYLGLIVACSIMTLARALTLVAACMRTSQNLHDQLFRRVLAAPVTQYFDVTPVGRILNRFSNDLDQMDAVLPEEYQLLFQNVSMAVGTLAVSAFASYWIAVLYIPLIVLFEYMGEHFKKTSCELKRLEGITRTPVYNLFSETLSGLATIRAFKMEKVFSSINRHVVDENASVFLSYWGAGRWLASRLDLLSVTIIFTVTTYLVGTRGQVGSLTSGISLTYSLMLTSVVQWVMRSVDRTDNAMTSVERLLHFRDIEVESGDGSSMNDIVGGATDKKPAMWPSRGAVRFEGLCLRYRPELPLVLRGVDLDIAAGDKVGICGRTGAGKSSLMVALFRICDFDSGRVVIDDVDIATIQLRELRRSLAIIPQDPVLFSGPLRENLDPFHEYSDERIRHVLQQVHMADSLRRWGAGLDFEVAEGGDNLSVGQRQLICIGRALLKDSKVVVLDEATANVDTATDALIQTTIKETFADKTVLIIAHRINTIMYCDKIAVMDAGQVSEFGSPSELLARPESVFAALAKRSGSA